MQEVTCGNCGKKNGVDKRRCCSCGMSLAQEFQLGDKVEWDGTRGSKRTLSGTIVAIIPEYMSVNAILAGTRAKVSMSAVAERERPYRSYVVDIGKLAASPAARYVVPSPFSLRLRKSGDGDGAE